MKKYNPIRQFREELGLNQFEFGRLIGRSHASVRVYEKSLEAIPDDVLETIQKLAAEKGFADIAMELTTDDWKVKTVIHPPAEFAGKLATAKPFTAPPGFEHWHGLLQEILASGDEDAVRAVQSNLEVFTKYVRVKYQRTIGKSAKVK